MNLRRPVRNARIMRVALVPGYSIVNGKVVGTTTIPSATSAIRRSVAVRAALIPALPMTMQVRIALVQRGHVLPAWAR